MAANYVKRQAAVQSMNGQGRRRQEGSSETANHAAYPTLEAHSFYALSSLNEIVMREIERRIALHLSSAIRQIPPHLWSTEGREPLGVCRDASPPLGRRRKVIEAFFAISAETEQPYRVTEDCDLWAVVPETEEDVPVSIYLDETHELLVEKSTFFASTKPFTAN